MLEESEGPGSPPPYKMIQTIGLSVGAAVAYIIAVLGLMFYCKKRCKAKRLQKQPEGEEPEMECLNGEGPPGGGRWCGAPSCGHGGESSGSGGSRRPWSAPVLELQAPGTRAAPPPRWKPAVGRFPGPWLLRNLA